MMRPWMLKAKYALFVGLCLWAMALQLRYRIVGDAVVPFLPWIGIGLSIVGSMLFLNYFLLQIPPDHPIRTVARWIDRGATTVMVLYVGYSLFLSANAVASQSTVVVHRSEIVSISGADIDLGAVIPYSWATVRSLEGLGEGLGSGTGTTRNVLLTVRERRRLWGGEAVLVYLREGAFGTPWVVRIERDEDHYAREVLKAAPTAASAWRNLIKGFIARQQWGEAVASARKYLEIYPADYSFAHDMGTWLVSARHANDRVFFLEQISRHQPDYENDQLLGFAYLQAGQTQKAVETFQASIPLKPKDWEAYYHLGLIDLQQLGKYQEAVDLFNQVLQFIPHFPMIERYRDEAQQKLSAQMQQRMH
ncbi:MAG: tetratricopeptide repeat protein [Nitrospirae bacterium]|nr:tetratricopeptide repeat protein [Nitrospirota bacterium]